MLTFNSSNCTMYIQLANSNNISDLQVPFVCVKYSFELEAFLIVVFSVLVFGTVGGNLLVILSVVIVKKLQTPSNFLIVNLACSDFLVSILVMPGAIYQQIFRNRWPFSELLCNVFISFDVILCTSSILNLCAISIDRYLVITRPLQYAVNRTPSRIGTMIAISWVLSGLISIPPLFGWKEKFSAGECRYSENLIYQIYATFGAFYIPLIVMLVLYGRIFKLARDLAQTDAKLKIGISPSSSDKDHQTYLRIGPTTRTSNEQTDFPQYSGSLISIAKSNNLSESSHNRIHDKNRAKIKSSTETKAITTLGVIMGCFTICWLPFFIIQIAKPVLKVANIEPMNCFPIWLIEFCLWLGYLNSFLNPLIYAKFNREFRTPFKQILLCRCSSINARVRSETFVQEYGLPNMSVPNKPTNIERTQLNNGDFTKNRRRRNLAPLISNSHLNHNHDKDLSIKIYRCSETQNDNKNVTDSTTSPEILIIDKIITMGNDFEDSPFHYSDHIFPYCSITDQRSEKYFYDFGPSSESVSVDPLPPINVSSYNLNVDY